MTIRGVALGVAGVFVVLSLGCNPCTPFLDHPTEVCVPGATVIEPGRAFTLLATAQSIGPVDLRCEVQVDGGALWLRMSGQSCPAPVTGRPAPVSSVVTCAVPALEARSYTVQGAQVDFVVNVRADAGVGLASCP